MSGGYEDRNNSSGYRNTRNHREKSETLEPADPRPHQQQRYPEDRLNQIILDTTKILSIR